MQRLQLMPRGSVTKLPPKRRRVLIKPLQTRSSKMLKTRKSDWQKRPTTKNTRTLKLGQLLRLLEPKKLQKNKLDSMPMSSKPSKMADLTTLKDIGTKLPPKLERAKNDSPETRSQRMPKTRKSEGRQPQTRRSMMT